MDRTYIHRSSNSESDVPKAPKPIMSSSRDLKPLFALLGRVVAVDLVPSSNSFFVQAYLPTVSISGPIEWQVSQPLGFASPLQTLLQTGIETFPNLSIRCQGLTALLPRWLSLPLPLSFPHFLAPPSFTQHALV
jgi:hypothetical protein